MTMELEHRGPDCTGVWRPEQQGLRWRCSECHKAYPGAPEVRAAAVRENAIGKLMRVLARLGQQKKDEGEELPGRWDR